jgi:hypothetical protein
MHGIVGPVLCNAFSAPVLVLLGCQLSATASPALIEGPPSIDLLALAGPGSAGTDLSVAVQLMLGGEVRP